MALTFVALVTGSEGSTSDTTVDASSSLNVAAGDVLIAFCKNESGSTTFAVAKNDGSGDNALTFDAGDKVVHSNASLQASFGYKLSATADAAYTPRLTLGAARDFKWFKVLQYRPDAGETVTKAASAAGQGNGTTISSGNASPTLTDGIAVGGYAEFVANNSANHQINGTATGVTVSQVGDTLNWGAVWRKEAFSSGFTGAATCTNLSADWIGAIIAFESAAAGGATTYPQLERGVRGLLRGIATGGFR